MEKIKSIAQKAYSVLDCSGLSRVDFFIDKDSGKIYVYVYNEQQLKLGDDGFVKPNEIIDASLKETIQMEIPNDSLLVLSSKEL